jgi:hypothetical protein
MHHLPPQRSLPRDFVPIPASGDRGATITSRDQCSDRVRASWAGKLNELLFSANAARTDKSLFLKVQSAALDKKIVRQRLRIYSEEAL